MTLGNLVKEASFAERARVVGDDSVDVTSLAVCDHVEPVLELLDDIEHRRPRAA